MTQQQKCPRFSHLVWKFDDSLVAQGYNIITSQFTDTPPLSICTKCVLSPLLVRTLLSSSDAQGGKEKPSSVVEWLGFLIPNGNMLWKRFFPPPHHPNSSLMMLGFVFISINTLDNTLRAPSRVPFARKTLEYLNHHLQKLLEFPGVRSELHICVLWAPCSRNQGPVGQHLARLRDKIALRTSNIFFLAALPLSHLKLHPWNEFLIQEGQDFFF